MKTKLIIKNTEHFIKIIDSLIDDLYNQEEKKYNSYIAMDFFAKNINFLNQSEIDKVLNNEKLISSISNKSISFILKDAIQNNKVFSNYSKKWFNNVKVNQPLLEQYLSILIMTEDSKQIEDFCISNPVLSTKYYKKNTVRNNTFEKYVIANNPNLIVKNTMLSEKDIINLIENKFIKYEHIKDVLFKYSYKLQTLVTLDQVNTILKYDFNKDEKETILKLFSENCLFFIKKIQAKNPEFLKKLLLSPGEESISNHPRIIPNFLQSLVLNESVADKFFNEFLIIVLHDYKNIIFKDIPCQVGHMKYSYDKEYFIHHYENKQYEILQGLAYFTEELNNFQKDIVLTACFESLLNTVEINKLTHNLNVNMYDKIKPIMCFSYSSILEKLEEIKSENKIEETLIIEIEKHLLNKKLNENLIKIMPNMKKNKI